MRAVESGGISADDLRCAVGLLDQSRLSLDEIWSGYAQEVGNRSGARTPLVEDTVRLSLIAPKLLPVHAR
ncbi:hypothetical protein C8T65DRAFT_128863 [Cerioporus squamosus]|nr:hypothetical protein C8T65DRAFT_128863 [Cerioporus squamosus]